MLASDKSSYLVFTPELRKGAHILSIEFINDLNLKDLEQDRNVLLGDVEIIYF